ncbi:hypothetical protein Nepgr_009427 [Nepenthes gracilis]|uniref:GIL1/IRKI C-terminal domain-containing protein n=1 Tax=Nepenthes gracilis TaxID=150966 RepID=A0AAD3XK52_NEPGR|nr:hypothetical protein Nepgr_009427 [Nepenthes gracilis]
MAAATISKSNSDNIGDLRNEASREEIRVAIAKAVELRELHSALMQGSSPADLRFLSSSSPVARASSQFSAHDYPVFTPCYEDEPLPRYHQIQQERQTLSEWEEYGLGESRHETIHSDYRGENASSRKALPPGFVTSEPHFFQQDDAKSATSLHTNHITVLQSSPTADVLNSRRRRHSLGDFKSANKYSHTAANSQPNKTRGMNLSWLFPRLKKKEKSENSPIRKEREQVSHVFKDLGIVSVEMLRKELMKANQKKDAALKEVGEMKSSFGELKQKLENLEAYCEELKRALRQAVQPEKLGNLSKRGKLVDGSGNGENLTMPVSEEVMVEGFLQIVSEARLSVKHFCKALISQIEESDVHLIESLNLLLRPYKLSLNSKYSKAVLYHSVAIINQVLYQDFENCVFQKNGSPKLLDPQQDRQAQFLSFAALRNLSWNQVLDKGTKYYSEDFGKFCDQKMSFIITTLNWNRKWPEQLLQLFFIAAKCIWLLHLLAFSFYPPLMILRIEENRAFDAHYMEDVFVDRQRVQSPSRVKAMVMPGFYVQDKILRCKVICRYKSVA